MNFKCAVSRLVVLLTMVPTLINATIMEGADLHKDTNIRRRELQAFTGRVTALELFDANTDTKVGNITPNMVIQSATPPSFNINAIVSGTGTVSVKFGFNTNANYRIENNAPFTFCNCVGTNYSPCSELGYGTYTITATSYSQTKAGGTAGVPFSVTFSIVPPVVAPPPTAPIKPPTKAPTKAPIKPPTRTPTKAPTKPPTKAPTKAPVKPPTKAPTKAPTKSPTKTPTKTPTKSPTKAPMSATPPDPRAEIITKWVNALMFSDQNLPVPRQDTPLSPNATPQEKALYWLVIQDPMFVYHVRDPSEPYTLVIIQQRFALATLYFQPRTIPWTNENQWVWGDECDWYGVTCRYIDHGPHIGEINTVVEINLYDNGLQGGIPPELARLSHLESLTLSYNAITGSIPSTLGYLDHLKWLDLSFNQLDGHLPETFGLLQNIGFISLSDNKLSGPLPESIGLLRDMLVLYCHNNLFSGEIPQSVAFWDRLLAATFQGNLFTGSIDAGICDSSNEFNSFDLRADCISEVECPCCTACY